MVNWFQVLREIKKSQLKLNVSKKTQLRIKTWDTLIRLLVELPERLWKDAQILHFAFVSFLGSLSKNFQTGLVYEELDPSMLSTTFAYIRLWQWTEVSKKLQYLNVHLIHQTIKIIQIFIFTYFWSHEVEKYSQNVKFLVQSNSRANCRRKRKRRCIKKLKGLWKK